MNEYTNVLRWYGSMKNENDVVHVNDGICIEINVRMYIYVLYVLLDDVKQLLVLLLIRLLDVGSCSAIEMNKV